ncbi:MAG: hypothetical protein MH208_17880 [Marinobacter sp.]|nr:hypothetical protein [Marinobacter sp.]
MALHMPTFLPRPSLSAFHTLPGISRVQAASQKLVANPLMTDSLALLNEYLPSPSPLLAAIDHRIPLVLKTADHRSAVERVVCRSHCRRRV